MDEKVCGPDSVACPLYICSLLCRLTLGWLIPIAILFIISFPPVRDPNHDHLLCTHSSMQLFGHEIVAILVGVIWGLGVGFAIVAAGTFLGEIGNY